MIVDSYLFNLLKLHGKLLPMNFRLDGIFHTALGVSMASTFRWWHLNTAGACILTRKAPSALYCLALQMLDAKDVFLMGVFSSSPHCTRT